MNDWVKKLKVSSYYKVIGLLILGIGLLLRLFYFVTPSPSPFDEELVLIADITESDEVESREEVDVLELTVEIKGSVTNPGVYTLPVNSRVVDLVAQAGGFTTDAYVDQLNQAQKLEDQMMIYVYDEITYQSLATEGELVNEEVFDPLNSDKESQSSLVNINTAELQDLLSLPGIGPKKAEAIQSYRQEHGDFKAIEELMEVSGIGPKTFESLKELVTVSSS